MKFIIIPLLFLSILLGCSENNPVNQSNNIVNHSLSIQFKDNKDTVLPCDRIIYDILRGEKITVIYNDTITNTFLINEIKYFKYE